MDYIEKDNKLSEEIKTFLFSDQPRLEAEKVCFMYGLDENDLEYITYPMGLIFVGDVKLNDYPKMLVDYMEILIKDQLKANEMGISGWEYAKDRFTTENYAENIYKIIKSI